MSQLAAEDPEAFEKRRRKLIEEEISKRPPERQEALRKLQWRIDMERKRAKTPLGACIKLNDMLMDQLYKEGGFIDSVNLLKNLFFGAESVEPPSRKKKREQGAKVISFKKPERKKGSPTSD